MVGTTRPCWARACARAPAVVAVPVVAVVVIGCSWDLSQRAGSDGRVQTGEFRRRVQTAGSAAAGAGAETLDLRRAAARATAPSASTARTTAGADHTSQGCS